MRLGCPARAEERRAHARTRVDVGEGGVEGAVGVARQRAENGAPEVHLHPQISAQVCVCVR